MIDGGCYRRSCGAPEITGGSLCRLEQQEDRRPASEKMNCPATCSWSRRIGNWLLVGGKATEEGEGAEEVRNYLSSRLVRAPDLSRVGAGRRWLSGCSGGLQWLAEAGSSSGRSSGAPRTIGRSFCSSSGRSEFVGCLKAAGGGGPCLLLVRRSGAFREVAGRLARLLG